VEHTAGGPAPAVIAGARSPCGQHGSTWNTEGWTFDWPVKPVNPPNQPALLPGEHESKGVRPPVSAEDRSPRPGLFHVKHFRPARPIPRDPFGESVKSPDLASDDAHRGTHSHGVSPPAALMGPPGPGLFHVKHFTPARLMCGTLGWDGGSPFSRPAMIRDWRAQPEGPLRRESRMLGRPTTGLIPPRGPMSRGRSAPSVRGQGSAQDVVGAACDVPRGTHTQMGHASGWCSGRFPRPGLFPVAPWNTRLESRGWTRPSAFRADVPRGTHTQGATLGLW